MVSAIVPPSFLETVPADRSVVLYVRARSSGPNEVFDEYGRLPSEFDSATAVVTTQVPNIFFNRFRSAGGSDPGRSRRNEIVLLVGEGPRI